MDGFRATRCWLHKSYASLDGTVKVWDIQTAQCLRTFHYPGPYDGMNITGVTGMTDAQRETLRALGAVEEAP